VVTEADLADDKVISASSYLTFWQDITKSEPVMNAFMQAVLDIIDKLDFETETFDMADTMMISGAGNDKSSLEQTDPGSLTMAIKSEEENQVNSLIFFFWGGKVKKIIGK
jgi:hypothetical protein